MVSILFQSFKTTVQNIFGLWYTRMTAMFSDFEHLFNQTFYKICRGSNGMALCVEEWQKLRISKWVPSCLACECWSACVGWRSWASSEGCKGSRWGVLSALRKATKKKLARNVISFVAVTSHTNTKITLRIWRCFFDEFGNFYFKFVLILLNFAYSLIWFYLA